MKVNEYMHFKNKYINHLVIYSNRISIARDEMTLI